MRYIKSHSNYVLKSRHQLTNDGVINERDITTIGGLNQFAKGQTPIYKSGNFIITVNDDNNTVRTVENAKWESNENGEIWTLSNIKNINDEKSKDKDSDNMIVLKQDYYDLRDFAYYGSCSELIRSSLIDILKRFPGELFAPSRKGYSTDEAPIVGLNVTYHDANASNDGKAINIKLGEKLSVNYNNEVEYDLEVLDVNPQSDTYNETYHTTSFSKIRLTEYDFNDEGEPNTKEYVDSHTAYKEIIGATPLFDGEALFLLDNPFNIDIHSIIVNKEENKNPLKYFCNNGASNYELVIGNTDNVRDIESVESHVAIDSLDGACPGDKLGDVVITFAGQIKLDIQVYLGDNNEIFYMLDKENFLLMAENEYHIRPKKEWFTKFYNECDAFEKLLINPRSTPKYTATFQIIKENDFGYYTEIESFTFPTTYGGYNIIGMTSMYDDYTSRLADIAAFYDERFSDNLYRSMTHEAIKNFDWTGSKDNNIINSKNDKIAKILRLFSVEFDKIKSYIDSINTVNSVTYDQVSNIPDYFLPDVLELDGWDVNSVKPFRLSEYEINGSNVKPIKPNTLSEDNEKKNLTKSNKYLKRIFSEIDDLRITPYSSNRNSKAKGYALICGENGWVRDCENPKNPLRDNLIKDYNDEIEYSSSDVNNEFMRRLKINSKHIMRHKGTIHGVEMILSMFGLKSKKWYDLIPDFTNDNQCAGKVGKSKFNNSVPYDYEIEEYTSFANPIDESWDDVHKMYKIDWYNSTKVIDYNNFTTSIQNTQHSDYISYQGLPVSYLDIVKHNNKNVYLKRGGGFTEKKEEAYVTSDGYPVLRRKLYPYFSKSEQMDGNFYFQMNGGWLGSRIEKGNNRFNFLFDKSSNIYADDSNENKIFQETLRTIKSVNTLQDLINISQDVIEKGDVYYVKNINGNYAIINGFVFNAHSEKINDETKWYIEFIVNQESIFIGDSRINDTVTVYDSSFNKISYNMYDMQDGEIIKAYINNTDLTKDEFIVFYQTLNKVESFTLMNNTDNNNEVISSTNYFKIDVPENSRTITVHDKRKNTWSDGWRQLNTNDVEYFLINSIRDYFKGNNPHCGNMKYDCGHEYFEYFQHIFKYPYENNLFDERCYRDGLNDIATQVYPIGFTGLINEDNNLKNYDKYLLKDSKVHYFGDYISPDGQYHIYTDDEDIIKNKVSKYGTNIVTSYGMDNIISGKRNVKDETYKSRSLDNGETIGFNNDIVTNQIVNNKRLLIRFFLHNNWNTNGGLCEIKYLNDVVIPYMTQMISSGTILEVVFSH